MSMLPDSTTPINSVPGASTASMSEKYGSENLPVLIQLPDLSALADDVMPETQPLAAEMDASLPAEGAWDEPDLEGEPSTIRLADLESGSPHEDETDCPHEDAVQGGVGEPTAQSQRALRLRQQRQQRRERVTRRNERQAAMPVWLRGIGKLTLSVVLAGVLLSVIITVKNWNAKGQLEPPGNDSVPIVEAPPIDFGPSGPEMTGDMAVQEAPSLRVPPLDGREPTLESMLPPKPAVPTFEMPGLAAPTSFGESASPVGRAPAATGQTANTMQYPTTGVEPVASVPGAPAGQDFPTGPGMRRWQETVPSGPVRSAERPGPPNSNQQFNQYR